MMDLEKMRLALELAAFTYNKHFEKLREENLELLRLLSLESELISFFSNFSFDDEVEIGAFTFLQANCLKKNYDWEEDFQRALESRLLQVGNASNGDIVVLDLEDYQVGILYHEYFWENDEVDPRMSLVKLGCSLGQFFLNSVTEEGYPIDAYEAAAYIGSEFIGYRNPEE
jgi:hypothetical protein